MATSKKKRPVNVDKETFDKFEYLYPEVTAIFINRALKLALQDKKFFENVFFNKSFIEVK